MTQLQQAQRRTTVLTSAVVAAAISVAITSLGVILIGVMVATGTLTVPAAQPDIRSANEISPALVEAGREWQAQRELLSGAFAEPIAPTLTLDDDYWTRHNGAAPALTLDDDYGTRNR